MIEFERGRYANTMERCQQLRVVAASLGENEAPVADTLEALTELAESSVQAFDRLEAALSRLRVVDDKSYLAYALNTAASLCLHREQPDVAQAFAQEARLAATAMQRHGEVAIAEATLARLGGRSHVGASDRAVRRLFKQVANRDRLNARAQAAIDEAAAVVPAAPTMAPALPTKEQ
ncbi:hypothetical protein [Halomonas salinarum]|uniref:hypothetical protein n=1 Tax=Halomonas salinarum TaxID=1158993 RepID=UPI00143B7C7D|nr:hypothetical protein [Halomonas salinarum]